MKVQPELSNFSTRPDDVLTDEICDMVIGKLIENLSKSLSFEFSQGSQKDFFFCMPKLDHLDLSQKSILARDLTELLYNQRNLKDSMDLRSSLESIKNFQEIENNEKDLVQMLCEGNEVYLSKKAAQDLVKLIFLECNNSESWKFRAELNEIQDQYVFISRKLKKALLEEERANESLQQEVQINDHLQAQVQVWKEKVEMVGKQIEDIVIEQFVLDEKTRQLQLEIQDARAMLSSIGLTNFDNL